MFKNKLTEEEIKEYIRTENYKTGVNGITEEDLKKIRLNKVRQIKIEYSSHYGEDVVCDLKTGKVLYKYDAFTPKAGSIYLKPSFAGRQVLMGRIGRKLYFSNGQWFSLF